MQNLANFTYLEEFFFKIVSMYVFLAVLGLRCYAQVFCSCGEQGLLSSCVGGLVVLASLVAERGL